MSSKRINLRWIQLSAIGLLAIVARAAPADVHINEILFNPPNPPLGEDSTREFIELRGTPGMSLANHYLIFVGSQINNGFGKAGVIGHIFNLSSSTACPSGCSLGSNGYLTIRQKGSGYGVAAGATNLINTGTGIGFGSGATSSVGSSDSNANGEIASGFTAMLVRVNAGGLAPTLNFDLDVGNNGLDIPTGRANWTILDSIGLTEPTEAYDARFYGTINFGTEAPDAQFIPSQHMEPGATYVATGFESEYAARWGNSTGQTAADWHVAGVTDNEGSGFQAGTWNFRQSTDQAHPAVNAVNLPPAYPGPLPPPTSTQGVPYGTILTNTLGAPNFMLGDYNKDGRVDAGDYVAWRNLFGQTGSDIADNPADGDHNYIVGSSDFAIWRIHFGQPPGSGAGAGSFTDSSSSVPETSSTMLAVLAALEGCDFWLRLKRSLPVNNGFRRNE